MAKTKAFDELILVLHGETGEQLFLKARFTAFCLFSSSEASFAALALFKISGILRDSKHTDPSLGCKSATTEQLYSLPLAL